MKPLEHLKWWQTATDYLAFLRRTEGQTCLVVLNMSDQAHVLSFELDIETVWSTGSKQF